MNYARSHGASKSDQAIAEAELELRERDRLRELNSSINTKYQHDIVAFAEDILHVDLAPYQKNILQALIKYRRVAVRGPHGLGKTMIASVVVLWSISVFNTDCKTVTTASAWRQLTKFLWPEIRKWAAKADWNKIGLLIRRGKELLDLSIKLANSEAFAVASDNPALIEGAHASRIVYVFDESKAISPEIFDAAEGAFSTGDCYALAISTPGDPNGRFYDIHKRKPGYHDWHVIHVTLQQAIDAGRISQEWADARKAQWGEKSAVYQNRVLGEFCASSEDAVVPLAWIEQANERWRQIQDGILPKPEDDESSYGVDPAYKGDNESAIAELIGDDYCPQIERYAGVDTMELAGIVRSKIDKSTCCAIDIIGYGAGTYDVLNEAGYERVIGVNVGESTELVDSSGELEFMNLRAALWWIVREWLDPALGSNAAIPDDDQLTGDLTAPTWKHTSSGKIQIEKKEDIIKRLGRSTDSADALMLAKYARMYGGTPLIGFA